VEKEKEKEDAKTDRSFHGPPCGAGLERGSGRKAIKEVENPTTSWVQAVSLSISIQTFL